MKEPLLSSLSMRNFEVISNSSLLLMATSNLSSIIISFTFSVFLLSFLPSFLPSFFPSFFPSLLECTRYSITTLLQWKLLLWERCLMEAQRVSFRTENEESKQEVMLPEKRGLKCHSAYRKHWECWPYKKNAMATGNAEKDAEYSGYGLESYNIPWPLLAFWGLC